MMLINTERTRPVTSLPLRAYDPVKPVDHSAIYEAFLSLERSEAECERFDELITHTVRINKGAELYHAGGHAQYLYFVRHGSFKTVLVSDQGFSLVTGFTMSAEPLGLEAITGELHLCSAVALEDSEAYMISYRRLESLARELPALRLNLSRMLSREITYGQSRLFTLGHYNSEERLAVFMLGLSKRFAERGYSKHRFLLRMSREDIALSIGVRSETICRAIARLRELSLMTVEGRSVEIIDIVRLKAFCQRSHTSRSA
ncbi:cyclic nucleotide-binding domain-containing protein [Pseudomonas sp. 1152_12]|uniref:cyclic nucleotide-binding domain-containing protein n=1 Tax=Pseudomonas sp. 1152_12 TaxID=2604455 RepID=UPI0040640583